jgi:hypothetical protein
MHNDSLYAFPVFTSLITALPGNSVMLGAFATSGDRQSGPVTDLPLENEGNVQMKAGLRINCDMADKSSGLNI